MREIKSTIILDLDDTLIDTSERQYNVYCNIFTKRHHTKPLPKESFWRAKRKGKTTAQLIGTINDKLILNKEWIKQIETRDKLQHDTLYPSSLKVLEILKHSQYRIILATLRNNKKNVLWETHRLKINHFFDDIIVAAPVTKTSKQDLFKNYLNKHTKIKFIAIIGDSETDIVAGKQLGIPTIAATFGIRTKSFLQNYSPNYFLGNINKLPKLLKRIGDKS